MEGFFPGKKYGGPPVSVLNFCRLMKEYSCYIVTKNHDLGETVPYLVNNGWNRMDRLEKIAGLGPSEIISVINVFDKVNEARLRVDRLMSKRDFLIMILNKVSEQIDEELIKYKKTQDELEEYIGLR